MPQFNMTDSAFPDVAGGPPVPTIPPKLSMFTDILGPSPLPSRQTVPFMNSDPLPSGGSGAGDWISQLLGRFKMKPQGGPSQAAAGMGDLASVLGAFSSGEKANRGLEGQFTQNYDRLMMDAQRERNLNESDALRKLQQTSYLTEGGSQFAPPTIELDGKSRTAPSFGFGPSAATDAEKTGATALQGQLQKRLGPDGSYSPTPLSNYAKPGLAEKIGSYGAAGVGGLGTVLDAFGGGGDNGLESTLGKVGGVAGQVGAIGGLLSKFGTKGAPGLSGGLGATGNLLGKAVPIAGIATGAYGLLKNNTLGSNMMNGASTGGSLGGMIGGPIGMGIGAGIGAGAGALKSLISKTMVSKDEKQGRVAGDQMISQINQGASPKQQQEAQAAGWENPNNALALIMVRDSLIKGGMDPQSAIARSNQLMGQLNPATKGGAKNVAAAYSPIQQALGGRG